MKQYANPGGMEQTQKLIPKKWMSRTPPSITTPATFGMMLCVPCLLFSIPFK